MQIIAPESTTTDRFTLRCWMPGDGGALQAATAESYEHLAPWMPWAKPDPTVQECELTVRRSRAKYLLSEDFVLAIFSPDGSRALGGGGYHLRETTCGHAAEIGMWIRASEAGRGLGTAVLVELVRWAFAEWPFKRISWRCDAQNVASCRTAEKAGLQLEGIRRGELGAYGKIRDGQTYSALASD